jgi:alpha-ketoglutarate-dependent taurine dioxygenase
VNLREHANDLIRQYKQETDPALKEILLKNIDYSLTKHADSEFINQIKNQIGVINMGDTYNISGGQQGSVGSNAQSTNNFIQQINSEIEDSDEQKLLAELKLIAEKVSSLATSNVLEKVNDAVKEVGSGNKVKALETLISVRAEVEKVANAKEIPITSDYLEKTSPEIIDNYEREKITPWKNLRPDKYIFEVEQFGDIQLQETLRRLQEFGICLIRFSGQTSDEQTLSSIFKLIGQVATQQNFFTGEIKTLTPKSGIEANTGSSAGDLGFHVDGTQHEIHPAMLMFQYIVTADIGGNSRFVDMAKVIDDLPKERKDNLLINLSRSDAATFEKKDSKSDKVMKITCPIFTFPDGHSLACRVRYDAVITCHSDCQSDFEYLRERTNAPSYQILFKPRRGDIIIFDNWRVMHARDEIYGTAQRHHNRVWLNALRPEHQANCKLGIRPLPVEVLATIKQKNQHK